MSPLVIENEKQFCSYLVIYLVFVRVDFRLMKLILQPFANQHHSHKNNLYLNAYFIIDQTMYTMLELLIHDRNTVLSKIARHLTFCR